jgi:shikimate dehydrogenase
MILDGHTRIIAHIGDPTESFKAPLIYNPYFDSIGLNMAVVPMGVSKAQGAGALPAIFRMTNVDGALITMPHKVSVVPMLDHISPAVKVAGACNAVRRRPDGTLEGDMFDGEGFALGVLNKGQAIAGQKILIVGAGGVGSAIAAALAARRPAAISLYDVTASAMHKLAESLAEHFPGIAIETGSSDPAEHDIVVNATPLGMNDNDPLPLDVTRLTPSTFVGEVVMKEQMTPLLTEAHKRGCRFQIGLDMLFEMIPAYLDFFDIPSTTPANLRALAQIGSCSGVDSSN